MPYFTADKFGDRKKKLLKTFPSYLLFDVAIEQTFERVVKFESHQAECWKCVGENCRIATLTLMLFYPESHPKYVRIIVMASFEVFPKNSTYV